MSDRFHLYPIPRLRFVVAWSRLREIAARGGCVASTARRWIAGDTPIGAKGAPGSIAAYGAAARALVARDGGKPCPCGCGRSIDGAPLPPAHVNCRSVIPPAATGEPMPDGIGIEFKTEAGPPLFDYQRKALDDIYEQIKKITPTAYREPYPRLDAERARIITERMGISVADVALGFSRLRIALEESERLIRRAKVLAAIRDEFGSGCEAAAADLEAAGIGPAAYLEMLRQMRADARRHDDANECRIETTSFEASDREFAAGVPWPSVALHDDTVDAARFGLPARSVRAPWWRRAWAWLRGPCCLAHANLSTDDGARAYQRRREALGMAPGDPRSADDFERETALRQAGAP